MYSLYWAASVRCDTPVGTVTLSQPHPPPSLSALLYLSSALQMPLLGLFSKKSKSPLKSSFGVSSTSNVSLNENGWVDINTATAAASTSQQQQPRQRQRQPPSTPSSPPARISNDECVYEPPARHSSLFPLLQDDKNSVNGSVQSHNGSDTRPAPNKLSSTSSQPLPPLPKKSLFNWYSSSKERLHTTAIPSISSTAESSDASFNLKSFRHVRPESPSFSSTTATTPLCATPLPHPPSPRASPALVPVPTSALPSAPVSFQVTSRKPRPMPSSSLSLDTSPTLSYPANQSTSTTPVPLPTQSRMAAGVFRQAARRSATSLSLGDPIVTPGESIVGQGSGGLTLSLSSEDDFKEMASFLSSPPKLPPLSFSFSNPDLSSNSTESVSISSIRPPRPRPPPSLATNQASSFSAPYTPSNHSSTSVPISALAPNSTPLPTALPPPSKSAPASTKHSSSSKPFSIQPGKRNNPSNNAFGSSSSDVSDSEEEESESESDGSDTGLPRVSRKRTVRPRNNTSNTTSVITTTATVTPGRPRAATTTATPPRPSPISLEASDSQLNLPSSISSQSMSNTARSPLTDSNNNPSLGRSALTPSETPVPRPPSTLSVYSNGGTRPRASASVGALHPSAKEARASVALANSRLSTATNLSTPKAMSKSLTRDTGSDTSESESEADSDEEDAPLSKLLPPKRPGTSMSLHSTGSSSSLQKKPLIDLSAPSTFSGRPVGAPAPISREEEEMPKPRILADTKGRSSPILKNTSSNPTGASGKIVSPSQPPHLSQQQQPGGKKPPQSSLSLSSGSTMSSPSSSGASLTTSSRGIGGASSDTSISPSDRNSRYHSFANGALDSVGGNPSSRSAGSGLSPSRISHANSPSLSLPSVVPPMRPFVRRDSPTASSTGDSSSGKVPLTPKEENDTPRNIRPPSAMVSSKSHPRPTHGRKTSVTFEDDVSFMDNGTKPPHAKTAENDLAVGEAKRRERRRTEARAAIELGKVVNGPPPVDEEEIALDARAQAAWPQFGMQMPMQPMPMPMQSMFGMGGNMGGMAMNPQMQMAFPNPMSTMPNNDPAFLAAHQQAMAIAKQTFQYAVAQQALAAANEEWERNSTMTGYMPVGNYMNMNMRGSMAFPPAMASMYAGSTGGGSLINGFGGLGGGAGAGGAWGGTRSVYGGSFGPAPAMPMGMRLSTYSSTDLTAMNPSMMAMTNTSGSPQAGHGQQRPGVRQRTRTAPSSQTSPVPPQAGVPPMPSPKSVVRTRAPAPPSSFRGVHG